MDHRITQEDLADLEHELSSLFTEMMFELNNIRQKRRIRVVQNILNNVRWHYGPPLEVERIECGDNYDD